MQPIEIAPRGEHRPLAGILVPLDGSEASREAIPYAVALHGDRLVFLRVLGGEAPGEDGGPLDFFAIWRRDRIQEVEADLRRLVAEHADAAATVAYEVRYGDAAEEIIAASAEFELVAMTSRGRGAVGRSVFGSVVDRVVRYGTRPTLVTRVDETRITDAFPTRVMVPLDGSGLAERALPLATRLAALAGVALHLVRVVGMDEILATVRRRRKGPLFDPTAETDADPYEVARQLTENEARQYLDDVAARMREAGHEVTTEMRGGTAAFELAWAADPDDLVVMSSRGQGGQKRWRIGSVVEKLIRESEAPVVVVPLGGEGEGGA